MKETNITVLMVEPGKNPMVTTIKNDLDSLQKAVSIGADHQGLIEIIGIDDNVCILCKNELKKTDHFKYVAISKLTFDSCMK